MTTIDQIREEALAQLEEAALAALEKHAMDLLDHGLHPADLAEVTKPYRRELVAWQLEAEQKIEAIILRGGRPLN